MAYVITGGACLLVGLVLGAFLWNRYKAKAAADLANVSKRVGS